MTVSSGATFDVNLTAAQSTSIGSIQGGGNIAIGAGTLTASGSSDLTFSGTISGTGGLTKSGSGTLTLTGTNTYTGKTTITGGAVAITADSNLGTAPGSAVADHLTLNGGTLLINETFDGSNVFASTRGITLGSSDGTLRVAATKSFTYGGVITGGAGADLTKAGTGDLVFTGVNTYSGATTISAGGGNLTISGSGSLGGGLYSGNIAITDSGSSLTFESSATQAFSGAISGAGALVKSGSNSTLTLAGTSSFTGKTTITQGTVAISNDNNLGAAATLVADRLTLNGGTLQATGSFTLAANRGITLQSASTISIDSGATMSYGGVVAGSGRLTKSGAGTAAFSGTNTYSAGTTVTGGTLSAATDRNLGAVPGSVVADHIILNGGTLAVTATVSINSNRGITLDSDDGTISVPTSTTFTYPGVIAGATGADFTKSGAGTLVLSGANTYAGNTTISGTSSTISLTGTLGATSTPATYAGTITIGSGAVLSHASISDQVLTGNINGAGALNKVTTASTSTLTLSGTASTYTGLTTISHGTLKITTDAALGGSASSSERTIVQSGATLEVAGDGTLSSAEPLSITGVGYSPTSAAVHFSASGTLSGAVTMTGSSTVSVSDTKTGTMSETVSGAFDFTKSSTGTLVLAGTNTYSGTTVLSDSGGTLSVTGTLGSGTYSPNISIGSSAIFSYDSASAQTLSGVISGAGTLRKDTSSAGTLTITNANTYTGPTQVVKGVVAITNNSALGTTAGSTAVSSDATLSLSGGLVVAEPLALAGDGVRESSLDIGAVRSASGNNTLSGAITLTAPTEIQTDADTLTIDVSSGASISGAHTLTTDGSGNTRIAHVIATSTGGLTKNGSGTLTLSGANTYTGETTVNSGSVILTNGSALGGIGGSTTVVGGATLSLAGGITVPEPISVEGSGIDSGGAIVNSAGVNVLSGLITITADTEVQADAGILVFNRASGNAITGSFNLTFDGAGNITVLDPIATGSGSIVKNGEGSLSLLATNTYAGSTRINAGSLIISADASLGTPPGAVTADHLYINGGALRSIATFTINSNRGITIVSGKIIPADGTTLTYLGQFLDTSGPWTVESYRRRSWVVPAGVTSVTITAYGGAAGTGGTVWAPPHSTQSTQEVFLGGAAGAFGKVVGTLEVTPGDVIGIYPGDSGNGGTSVYGRNFYSDGSCGTGTGGTGGSDTYPGGDFAGASGATSGASGCAAGGGGGGAASVVTKNDVIQFVAAGAGGGGGATDNASGTAGAAASSGSLTPTWTISTASRTSNVATLIAEGHTFAINDRITVTGLTGGLAALNGTFTVTAVTNPAGSANDTVSYASTGSNLASGSGSGDAKVTASNAGSPGAASSCPRDSTTVTDSGGAGGGGGGARGGTGGISTYASRSLAWTITQASATSSSVTLTVEDHRFAVGDSVAIAGMSGTANSWAVLNGNTYTVTAVSRPSGDGNDTVTFAYAFPGAVPFGTTAGTTTGTFGDCKGIGAGASTNFIADGVTSTTTTTESNAGAFSETIFIAYTPSGGSATTDEYRFDEARGGTLSSRATSHSSRTVTVASGIVSLSHTDCGITTGGRDTLPIGTVTVASGARLNLTIGGESTATCVLTGATSGGGTVYKYGAATMELTSGSHATDWVVAAGRLRNAASGSMGDITVDLGATWDLNDTNQSIDQLSASGSVALGSDSSKTFTTAGGFASGVISGAGNLKITSGDVLTLTGSNTYTGITTLSGGSVRFNSDLAFGAAPGTLTSGKIVLEGSSASFYAMSNLEWNANRGITNNMNNNATVTFGADGGVTWNIGNSLTAGAGVGTNQSLAISCYSGCSNVSRSTVVLNGSLRYSGSTAIESNAIYRLTQDDQIPNASDLSLNFYSQLELTAADEAVGSLSSGYTSSTISLGSYTLTAGGNNASDKDFYGVISGTGGFTKSGTGSLRFTNNHTYTGATSVSAGTLRVDANGSLGESGSTRSTTTVASGATLEIGGTGTPNIAEPIIVEGTSGSNGTIYFSDTGTLSGTLRLAGNTTLNVADLKTSTISATVSDGASTSGPLTKTGLGLATLSASNNYTGTTTISAGRVAISNASALGASAAGQGTTVASLATLQITNGITVAEPLVISGIGWLDSNDNVGAIRSLSGANTISSQITLDANAEIQVDADSLTITSGVTGTNRNLTVQVIGASATLTSGAITTGTGQLLMDPADKSAGTLVLNGANTFTGAVTVSAGTGTLNSGSYSGNIANAGSIKYSSSAAQTLSGVISGVGSLMKDTENSTLTLAGTNTYTGATTVNAGVVAISNASALGNASTGTTVASNATLAVSGGISVGEPLSIAGDGVTESMAEVGAIRSTSGANTITSLVTLAAAAEIQADADTLTFDPTTGSALTGTHALTFDTNAGAINVLDPIATSTGTVTKIGSETLSLSGANTYSGITTISAGTLSISGAGSLERRTITSPESRTMQRWCSRRRLTKPSRESSRE
jgi:autotransporter-associated beta strand protein